MYTFLLVDTVDTSVLLLVMKRVSRFTIETNVLLAKT